MRDARQRKRLIGGKEKPQDLHRRNTAGGRYLGNYQSIVVEAAIRVKGGSWPPRRENRGVHG